MSDGNPQLKIRVSQEWLDAIDEHAQKVGFAGKKGTASGRSTVVRQALAHYLKLELPPDAHKVLSEERKGKPNPYHFSKKPGWKPKNA